MQINIKQEGCRIVEDAEFAKMLASHDKSMARYARYLARGEADADDLPRYIASMLGSPPYVSDGNEPWGVDKDRHAKQIYIRNAQIVVDGRYRRP